MKWYIIFSAIVSIILWICVAQAAVTLRVKKGHEPSYLFCYLFGLCALIYAAGLPDLIVREKLFDIEYKLKQKSNYSHIDNIVSKEEFDTTKTKSDKINLNTETKKVKIDTAVAHMWRCNGCGELIDKDVCPYCGYKH